MLDNADAKGPVMIYDAQDGKDHDRAYHAADKHGNLSMPFDRPILGIARLDDPTDKYLMKWSRAEFNPVTFTGGPKDGIAFPGPIWKEGDHWNFIGQGSLFSAQDDTFETWTRKDQNGTKVMDALGGGKENSGQSHSTVISYCMSHCGFERGITMYDWNSTRLWTELCVYTGTVDIKL